MTEFDPIAYINEPRWQESRFGLQRVSALLQRMGNPHDKLKFVHVAGTNGKGSTSAYVAQVLQHAGYRTGLFTSPYIMRFEERIRVNGRDITLDELREATLFVRQHAEALAEETGEHATEFELMSAVAFQYFATCGCDIVVCEVGLGGRLDSTNVIAAPEVCVITRIGLDHTDLLGDTFEAVAREKAGIIKTGSSVVAWPQEDEGARRAIQEAADACGCTLSIPDFSELQVQSVQADGMRPFTYEGQRYYTRLLARYQPFNAALAIQVVQALRARGWNISDQALTSGIQETQWPARFEVAQSANPTIIVDGGHNAQGARALADSLQDVFPGKPITFVMSVLADKDYRGMIDQVLPLAAAFVCVTPPNLRALHAHDLMQAINEQAQQGASASLTVSEASSFSSAIEEARQLAGPQGIICAFGSLYSVAEIKAALANLA